MADVIQAIFVTPGLAIARLGGSSTPQSAYEWVDTAAPRADGETSIRPAWSIALNPDGSIQPFLSDTIAFRDGDLIRPVAPLFEIWARVGAPGSARETWTEVPLTPVLMQENGLDISALSLQVTARNLKAARRASNPQLAFGTFPPLTISANHTTRVAILGVSPPTAFPPMIPVGRSIPLGSIQFARSTPQPADQPWSGAVSIETIRFRFTPATGLFYGPPAATQAVPQNGRPAPAVRPENGFLDAGAGWFNEGTGPFVEPGDTYDVINQRNPVGPSLGVVDDTCEVHFELSLSQGSGRPTLTAKAVAFVGPPDFAPDRRPFLSAADELNDREANAGSRNAALTDDELDQWVADLFERVYETVSLFNVDLYRRGRAAGRPPRSGGPAPGLPPDKLRQQDVDRGQRDNPDWAMGGRDALRNQLYAVAGPTPNDPLPLSEHARMRHRAMSDLQNLIEIIALNPDRIKRIVRPPFEVEAFENGDVSSMRMPPFMRQSNAQPLSLANWQYELLLRWVERTRVRMPALRPFAAIGEAPTSRRRPLSPSAEARRTAVLARIDAASRTP